MSLGTGALNVGRAPAKAGGIHGNPMSRNHPCKQLPTGTVTLNQQRSASIREDLREHMLNDQLEPARICNKSSNLCVKARINHG